ncbi:hypothetical protein ACFU5Z_21235 [Streptomyces sp. NPDC057521]|uniref:hypothetical protein n=1 Tax=Streptomyces sp. NPDC057521 TaxID=3346156 RepID=UPI0036B7BBED
MSMRENTIVQTLFPPRAQTAEWMAAARTPETRARIRRWARLKRVCLVLAIPGTCVFVLVLVGFPLLAVAGLFVPGLRIFTDAPWWVAPVALAALVAVILPWFVASLLLEAACYADGTETLGTITEVVVDTTSDSEGQPQYDLTIAAELDQDASIRRSVRTAERREPRVGQTVRFLHNTLDPGALDDILYLGIVDNTPRRRRS